MRSAQCECLRQFGCAEKQSLLAALDKTMVRAALHSRAQQQYEPRNHSRFPFIHVAAARAECLTLMPGQPANAGYGRAPGRHLGFTDVTLGGPFATPRARLTVSCHWTSFPHSNRSGWRMILGAVSGIETSSLRSSTGKDSSPASPSRHLCSCLAPSIGTVSPAHELGNRTPA